MARLRSRIHPAREIAPFFFSGVRRTLPRMEHKLWYSGSAEARQSITAQEQEKREQQPLLYRADGTPLAPQKQPFGFQPQRAAEK